MITAENILSAFKLLDERDDDGNWIRIEGKGVAFDGNIPCDILADLLNEVIASRPRDDGNVILSRETAETIFDIYVESDDLNGAAMSTIRAAKELRQALGRPE